MSCKSLVNNPSAGSFCFNGQISGFALSETAITASIVSLKTQAWWDAQIYDATDKVSILIGADESEIVAAEVAEYVPTMGTKIQTSKASNEYVIKMKDTECLRSTVDELNGQELYAFFFTKSEYLQGVRSGTANLKNVKCQINVKTEVAEGVRLIVISFTFPAIDFETLYVEEALDFLVNDITLVGGLTLEVQSCSTTTSVVKIVDCANTGVAGLTTTNIGIYDITAAGVVATSWVDNGAGQYTGTGTYVSGNDVKPTYAGPASGNLYVQESINSIEVS